MTTPYLPFDIAWDEAPNGEPILLAYPDPLNPVTGPYTIGLGSTGKDIGPNTMWTREECFARRDADVARIISQCQRAFVWWDDTSPERQDVFVNMAYQMGFTGLLDFHATLAAAARGAWETVAADMRTSLWNHQTHSRSERLAEQARTGVRVPRSYDSQVQPLPAPSPQPKETALSFLSKFVFNPILAEIARGFASSNPVSQAVANAASGPATATALVVGDNSLPPTGSPNSPMGQTNPMIQQLEDDLNAAVAQFVATTVSAEVPVVGMLVAPKAAELTKMALQFAENHALTYVAGLFHFHINTQPVPSPVNTASSQAGSLAAPPAQA